MNFPYNIDMLHAIMHIIARQDKIYSFGIWYLSCSTYTCLALYHPRAGARPLARLSGFIYFVGYVSRGQAPWLLYAVPPGLSSCRGACRGKFTTRAHHVRLL